jgi:Ner family transcriptional regulator
MTRDTAPKKPAPSDWHPADVIAAIRKAGWSLQQLAFAHGYTSRTALANALHKPYPKAEAIIAGTLGVPPQTIWPSRYNTDGTTNRSSGGRPMRPANAQPSTALRAVPKPKAAA